MEYCDKCGWIKPQCQCEKPITNADRIRNMSDEEFYVMFNKIKFCGGLITREESSLECRGCKEPWCCDILRWLKTEVNE